MYVEFSDDKHIGNIGKIKKITISKDVEYIDENTFEDSSVEEIKFEEPSKLYYFKERAFSYCHFTTIVLPKSLEIIDRDCFRGCYSLESVTFPSTLTDIKEDAFCWCEKLKKN